MIAVTINSPTQCSDAFCAGVEFEFRWAIPLYINFANIEYA